MTKPHETAEAFTVAFRNAEYALKRSTYVRGNRDFAEADWDRFAKDLGRAFFDDVVQRGIAPTLIGTPPRKLQRDLSWVPAQPEPLRTVAQLIVNGVCRVRNSLFHGEKFVGSDGQWERDQTLIVEAHAVLEAAMEHACL